MASDPPEHTRLRRLISSGFTPRMIAKLDEKILHFTTQILDNVVARGGEVDFVRDVAYLLPMQMIAEIMGLPEADRPAIFGDLDITFRAGDPNSDITGADYTAAMTRLYEYAEALRSTCSPATPHWGCSASVAELPRRQLEGPSRQTSTT